jgi:hypothetical protein
MYHYVIRGIIFAFYFDVRVSSESLARPTPNFCKIAFPSLRTIVHTFLQPCLSILSYTI